MAGLEKLIKELGEWAKGFETLASDSGKTTYSQGKRTGPSSGMSDNLRNKTVISSNAAEAQKEKKYQDFRDTGEVEVDEDGNIDEDLMNSHIDKLVKEETDRAFKGSE